VPLHLTSQGKRTHRPQIKDHEASFFMVLDCIGGKKQMRDSALAEDEVESSGGDQCSGESRDRLPSSPPRRGGEGRRSVTRPARRGAQRWLSRASFGCHRQDQLRGGGGPLLEVGLSCRRCTSLPQPCCRPRPCSATTTSWSSGRATVNEGCDRG
jgi:hypothetical protein